MKSLEELQEIPFKEIVMLDPGPIERYTRPLIFRFGAIYEGNDKYSNLTYVYQNEIKNMNLYSIGNAIYLASPICNKGKIQPKIETITSNLFLKREHCPEEIYIGEQEIIDALEKIRGMEIYAKAIKNKDLYTKSSELPLWIKMIRKIKPDFYEPLRFKKVFLNKFI